MKVVMLISRQERRVTPDTWWLRAAHAACGWAAPQGWTLIGSGGMLPIEFVRWAYGFHGGSVELIDAQLRQSGMARRTALRDCDRRACASADVLVAVSVRAGGIMEEEGHLALKRGKIVWAIRPPLRTKSFAGNWKLIEAGAKELTLTELDDAGAHSRRAGTQDEIRDDHNCVCLRAAPDSRKRWIECQTPQDYFWHFTRPCPGQWPGQSLPDYFRSLIDHAGDASHTGLDAILRILKQETIRASDKAIRGKHPVVCFTAERPEILLPKRRFLAARARWDFQPYAVGFSISSMLGMGAREVRYLSSKEFDKLPAAERPFFQRSEPATTDWTHEKEWRHAGSFCFSRLPVGEWRCLMPSREVEIFMKRISNRHPKG